jgi:hypothetical protein
MSKFLMIFNFKILPRHLGYSTLHDVYKIYCIDFPKKTTLYCFHIVRYINCIGNILEDFCWLIRKNDRQGMVK